MHTKALCKGGGKAKRTEPPPCKSHTQRQWFYKKHPRDLRALHEFPPKLVLRDQLDIFKFTAPAITFWLLLQRLEDTFTGSNPALKLTRRPSAASQAHLTTTL